MTENEIHLRELESRWEKAEMYFETEEFKSSAITHKNDCYKKAQRILEKIKNYTGKVIEETGKNPYIADPKQRSLFDNK